MEENVLKSDAMEKFVIDESTAKVAELVLLADGLSKQIGKVFSCLYGEKQADEALKEFEEAFKAISKGLVKHLGMAMYEAVINEQEAKR